MSPDAPGRESDSVVVTAADELVLDSAEPVEQLHQLLGAGQSRIVLDLRQARYVSGIGLGLVADAAKQARRQGGDVKLVALRPEMRRVFELGGLDSLLEFYDDIESARNAFTECVGEVERALLWRQFGDE